MTTWRVRSLALNLVLPLTVISFAVFTKWWYALPVDAPDTMFTGFPLIYTCAGWHTSMSQQIFMTELIVDVSIYFLFWLGMITCLDRFVVKVRTFKWLTIGLWTVSGLFVAFGSLFASNTDNVFYIKRPFEIRVLETGYSFIWQQTERPDYYKYFPKSKSECKWEGTNYGQWITGKTDDKMRD